MKRRHSAMLLCLIFAIAGLTAACEPARDRSDDDFRFLDQRRDP
ncbi:MAG: hypothetical protein ACFCUO_01435 [Rhodospirillales bacterium]